MKMEDVYQLFYSYKDVIKNLIEIGTAFEGILNELPEEEQEVIERIKSLAGELKKDEKEIRKLLLVYEIRKLKKEGPQRNEDVADLEMKLENEF